MLNHRWMLRRDLPEVLAIDRESYPEPWSESRCVDHMGQRNCIGMVVELDEHVVGYVIYELQTRHMTILRMAVAASCRRLSVGSEMIDRLEKKLDPSRRTEIMTEVGERNLGAQMFLRACEFRCTLTMHFDGRDDVLLFKRQPFAEQGVRAADRAWVSEVFGAGGMA